MHNVWAIYRKELRHYLASPLFYVTATVFLGLSGFFFHSDLQFYVQFGYGMNILGHFWQLLFLDIRLVTLLAVPLLTMRLLAEERRLGTFELLCTYPLREGEILLGKLAASMTILVALFSCTALYAVFLYAVQPYDVSPVFAGYFGLVALGATCLVCGLFLSSLTDSQAIAGLSTTGLLLLLWMVDWNEGIFDERWRSVVKAMSLFEHFTLFANGVIDAADVFFYLVATSFFATLALRSMQSRRWRRAGRVGRPLLVLVTAAEVLGLLALGAAVEPLLRRQSLRLDLTPQKAYSLSAYSKQILDELRQPVTLLAFIEREDSRLPLLAELLEQMSTRSGFIRARVVSGSRNPALAREYGVQATAAVVVESGDSRRIVLDFSEPALMEALLQVTRKFTRKVYFLTGHGEKNLRDTSYRSGYSLANIQLERELYEVQPLSLMSGGHIPEDASALVIAGPKAGLLPRELDEIDRYLRGGGAVMILLDPGGSATLASFLERYGLKLPDRVVLDPLQALSGGEPWTFRITDRPEASGLVSELRLDPVFSVSRPILVENGGLETYPLLRSSKWSRAVPWRGEGTLGKAALSGLAEGDRGPFLLGVQVVFPIASSTLEKAANARPGRLVVYGDSDFADNFFIDLLGNRDLFANTVSWIVAATSIHGQRPMRRPLGIEQFFISTQQSRYALWLACVLPMTFASVGTLVFVRAKLR